MFILDKQHKMPQHLSSESLCLCARELLERCFCVARVSFASCSRVARACCTGGCKLACERYCRYFKTKMHFVSYDTCELYTYSYCKDIAV